MLIIIWGKATERCGGRELDGKGGGGTSLRGGGGGKEASR